MKSDDVNEKEDALNIFWSEFFVLKLVIINSEKAKHCDIHVLVIYEWQNQLCY